MLRPSLTAITRLIGGAAAVLLLLALAAAARGQARPRLFLPLIVRPEGFRAESLANAEFATAIAGLPDGRLLVGERTGRIWMVWPDGRRTLFLDLRARVTSGHLEQGLLAITIDPRFADNGYVYVMYTGQFDGPNSILVSRFRAAGDAADPASEVIALSVRQSSQVHHGGGLAFSPVDGLLYVGIGDGRVGAQAQRPDSVRGKVVRLAVAGLPPGDPPPLTAWLDARTRVGADLFAQGLRNPWRIAFDPATGDLFMADVGELTWEEINYAAAGQRILNFGWPCREGPDVLDTTGPCAGKPFIAPIHVYGHDGDRCAIIGGGVVRLDAPTLARRYVFGDFCSGEIMALQPAGEGWAAAVLGELPGGLQLTGLGRDAAGRFYAATAAQPGPIWRLTLPPP